jgi:CO/xanthine dehydrogenase FAD-binding subunit
MWDLREYRMAGDPVEALKMMRAGPGRGFYIAGGTDLYLEKPRCDFVVDISRAGLSGLVLSEEGDLAIGAATPLQELVEDERVRGFAGGAVSRVAAQCGNRPVRSTATIGGNLCHALPSGDLAPVLLALDATCLIMGLAEQEEADQEDAEQETISLKDFFVGPRLTVLDGRLLAGLYLPAAARHRVCLCHKFSRSAEDICLVQVAVALEVEAGIVKQARIALGAVAPVPLRSTLAENVLTDRPLAELDEQALSEAAELAAGESEPIDDHRASADYRRHLVQVMTRRLLTQAVEGGAA